MFTRKKHFNFIKQVVDYKGMFSSPCFCMQDSNQGSPTALPVAPSLSHRDFSLSPTLCAKMTRFRLALGRFSPDFALFKYSLVLTEKHATPGGVACLLLFAYSVCPFRDGLIEDVGYEDCSTKGGPRLSLRRARPRPRTASHPRPSAFF